MKKRFIPLVLIPLLLFSSCGSGRSTPEETVITNDETMTSDNISEETNENTEPEETKLPEIVDGKYLVEWIGPGATVWKSEYLEEGTIAQYDGEIPEQECADPYRHYIWTWDYTVVYSPTKIHGEYMYTRDGGTPIISTDVLEDGTCRLNVSLPEPGVIDGNSYDMDTKNSFSDKEITEIYYGTNVRAVGGTFYGDNNKIRRVVFSKEVEYIESMSFYPGNDIEEFVFEGDCPVMEPGAFSVNGPVQASIIIDSTLQKGFNPIQIDSVKVLDLSYTASYPDMTLDEYSMAMLDADMEMLDEWITEAEECDSLYMFLYPYCNTLDEFKEIKSITDEVVKACRTEEETINAIYNYVRTTINYDYDGMSYLPLQALKERKGVCYQYATVMHDMLATQGIVSYIADCLSRNKAGYETIEDAIDNSGYDLNNPESNAKHAIVALELGGKTMFYDPTWGISYQDDYEAVATNYYVAGLNSVMAVADCVDIHLYSNKIDSCCLWYDGEIYPFANGEYNHVNSCGIIINFVNCNNFDITSVNDGKFESSGCTKLGVAYRNCIETYDNSYMNTNFHRVDGLTIGMDSIRQFLTYLGKERILEQLYEKLNLIRVGDFLISESDIGDGYALFYYLGNEENLTLPSSIGGYEVTEVDYEAFYGNADLKEIHISEGYTAVRSSAFENCTSLTDIYIPSTVEVLGGIEADGRMLCTEYLIYHSFGVLENYHVAAGNSRFKDINGVLYTADGTTLLAVPPHHDANISFDGVTLIEMEAFDNNDVIEELTIPGNVLTVSCSFQNCLKLKSITLEDGITEILGAAFYGCKSLKYIQLPSTVQVISEGLFMECCAVREIVIPEGVTTIESNAFTQMYGLYSITIPSTVTVIGQNAFYDDTLYDVMNHSEISLSSRKKIYGLKSVYNESLTSALVTSGDFVFYEDSGEYTLIAYNGCDEAVYLPDDINGASYSISSMLFYYDDQNTSIELSMNLGRRKTWYFECDFANIKEVHIPSSVSTGYVSKYLSSDVIYVYE